MVVGDGVKGRSVDWCVSSLMTVQECVPIQEPYLVVGFLKNVEGVASSCELLNY